ncbi:MAG: hypothetical protein KY450_06845, partial [Actinobacteria bacterium]|nr:hypothetical protein [Actinomycetota bacterium]
MTPVGQLLATWLPHQRWYAGKGAAVSRVVVERDTPLEQVPGTSHVLMQVETDSGTERYQLLLGRLSGDVPQRLQSAVIGDVDGDVLYEAVHDQEAACALLARLTAGGETDGLLFTAAQQLDPSDR